MLLSFPNPGPRLASTSMIIKTALWSEAFGCLLAGDVNASPPGAISCVSLYSLLQDTDTSVLIMDVRVPAHFQNSHINHKSCINVPEDIIAPGYVTARGLKSRVVLRLVKTKTNSEQVSSSHYRYYLKFDTQDIQRKTLHKFLIAWLETPRT